VSGGEGDYRRLATPEGTRAALRRFGIRPAKRWGQHFLVSPRALQRILEGAAPGPGDSVLEVGAGLGTLTGALAERAGWVTALEVDRRLLPALHALLGSNPRVRVVVGDILQIDPTTLFGGPPDAPRKVVANLPYNIAAPALVRLLESPLRLALMVVTVQREVADRIAGRPGTRAYGRLSVAVQFRAAPRILARLPRGAFLPPPEVESAIVELRPHARPPATVGDERVFFRVVAAGFGYRRKTLVNALVQGLGLEREAVEAACASASLAPGVRAETLDLQAFARLAEAVRPYLT
jgi:16S rRNA (adenine1518-N6/adenine1519-N6)-dimethyltransferase